MCLSCKQLTCDEDVVVLRVDSELELMLMEDVSGLARLRGVRTVLYMLVMSLLVVSAVIVYSYCRVQQVCTRLNSQLRLQSVYTYNTLTPSRQHPGLGQRGGGSPHWVHGQSPGKGKERARVFI